MLSSIFFPILPLLRIVTLFAAAVLGVVIAFVGCLKSWVTTVAWLGYFITVFTYIEIGNHILRFRIEHHTAHNVAPHISMADWIGSIIFGLIVIVFLGFLIKGSTKLTKGVWTRVLLIACQLIAAVGLTVILGITFGIDDY
ncbi:MAG TPA: hypothetical protein VFV23_11865 [Verrucomicrobiae bacterium]|nr:hypothetical protein [Verrucomicrobiae bacterium]